MLAELEVWPTLEEVESSSEKVGLVRRFRGSRVSGDSVSSSILHAPMLSDSSLVPASVMVALLLLPFLMPSLVPGASEGVWSERAWSSSSLSSVTVMTRSLALVLDPEEAREAVRALFRALSSAYSKPTISQDYMEYYYSTIRDA